MIDVCLLARAVLLQPESARRFFDVLRPGLAWHERKNDGRYPRLPRRSACRRCLTLDARRVMVPVPGKLDSDMASPRWVDTYLKVRDMDRAVSFYETFLGIRAKYRYQSRWASITDGLGLYRPAYDVENNVPMTGYDRDVRMGNNVVVVFGTDDIEREHERVKAIRAKGVTDIVEINLMAPYRFFQFEDTEGNVVEVGRLD